MKALHVFLALTLIGCSGGSTGLASPTPPTFLEVETPSPSSTPAPLMNGLPTTFAPCAGNARTVKRAAYNCLRDWKPTMETYPGKVVYHFSPSITSDEKAAIREVTEFVLARAADYIELVGFAPEFHLFYNMDSPKVCKQQYQSWAGTMNKSWLWENGQCKSRGWGGNGIGSDIPQTTSAGVSIPRSDPRTVNRFGPSGEWSNFDFYTYWVLPAEARYGFIGSYSEFRFADQSTYLRALPYWITYISGTTMGNAAGIQMLNSSLEQYAVTTLSWRALNGERATWQPSVADPRFGPGSQIDLVSLEEEIPWRYDVQFLATQYITAMFGPEWIDQVLIPSLLSEPGSLDDADAFRDKADRVAAKVWGGTWGEFEAAIDEYVIAELKALGVTGLK